MSNSINTGVTDSVAENQPFDDVANFKPIPEEQLIDAATAMAQEEQSPHEPGPVSKIEGKVENPQAENFEAFRKEIKEKIAKIDELEQTRQQERQKYEAELALLKGQFYQEKAQKPRKEEVLGEFQDDYVPSVGELKRAFSSHEQKIRDKMDEIETMQSYPDYKDVLEKHLVPFIKDKPHFAQMIAQAPNKALAAYELGRMARNASQPPSASQPDQPRSAPQRTAPSEIAQRIVENANKPGSLSMAGGSHSPLSKADYYASLSDEEFMKVAMQNLGSI